MNRLRPSTEFGYAALQELVDGNVQSWNSWRETEEYRPILTRIDLRGKNLRGANLRRCGLSSASFAGSDLSGAEFSMSNLCQADFARADLSRANLSEANCKHASFRGANLESASLESANLKGAKLERANLTNANLDTVTANKASFAEARMQGSSLRSARLERSIFTRSELCAADLRGATLDDSHLIQCNLTGARLMSVSVRDARFDRATFGWTVVEKVDLSEAAGLDSTIHVGPSSIGIDVLRRSEGFCPEPFLRHCGLADWELSVAKLYDRYLSAEEVTQAVYRLLADRKGGMESYYSCFISYGHADSEFAHKLYSALTAQGIRCWLDQHQVLPGDDIYEQVDRGVRLWDKILLCCSEASLRSWWVDGEIDAAFEKERSLMKEHGQKILALVPLDLDGFVFSSGWKSGKARQIRSRLVGDFSSWRSEVDFEQSIEKLLRALDANSIAREAPPSSKLGPKVSP